MSRRRLSFFTRKGYSRRWATSTLDSPLQLIVQLPLASYTHCTVPDASSLHCRLSKWNGLPADWNTASVHAATCSTASVHAAASTNNSDYLAVYKLCIIPPLLCAGHSFMLTIAPDCTWTLFVGRNRVDTEQCLILADSPYKLCSVDAVARVVSVLEGSKFCQGNPDKQFTDLIQSGHYSGSFRDQSG